MNIAAYVDHTLLKVNATWEEIKQLCDEAVSFETASICIPPAYAEQAVKYLNGKIPVCTVIGFPNGYSTKNIKVSETEEAIATGVSEVDMVINIGFLKSGYYDKVQEEIEAVKKACGTHILKVIIETCLLTDEEKVHMCKIVTDAGADFIKTSTGFSKYGATFHDVELLVKNVGEGVKVKASGGIKTIEDAEKYIELGAERLGTSSIVQLLKGEQVKGY